MRTLLTILIFSLAGLAAGCSPAVSEVTALEAEAAPAETVSSGAVGEGNANVTFVRAVLNTDGSWTFIVTVAHPDTGWEDYADGWDVVLPDGTVVRPDPDSPFTRLLLHPHVEEQPFTRAQSGILIPGDINRVTVRAHDIVDGFGGAEITLDLESDLGVGYEIERP